MRISDWSSDVCSSDLRAVRPADRIDRRHASVAVDAPTRSADLPGQPVDQSRLEDERAPHRDVVEAELHRLLDRGALVDPTVQHQRHLHCFAELERLLEEVGLLEGIFLEERSEEHTSELQSLMRISYAVFCL